MRNRRKNKNKKKKKQLEQPAAQIEGRELEENQKFQY
jgi:hypothetical protein